MMVSKKKVSTCPVNSFCKTRCKIVNFEIFFSKCPMKYFFDGWIMIPAPLDHTNQKLSKNRPGGSQDA